MNIKLTDKHKQRLISTGQLMEDYAMRQDFQTYLKVLGGVACGGVEWFAEMQGYYPITVNGLAYWTDDIEVYENGMTYAKDDDQCDDYDA